MHRVPTGYGSAEDTGQSTAGRTPCRSTGPSTRCRLSSVSSPGSTYARPRPRRSTSRPRCTTPGRRRVRRSPGSSAVGCLIAALALLAAPRSLGRVRSGLRTGFEGAALHAHLADAVVVLSLVGWWVIAPVIWDDGWVVARGADVLGVRRLLDVLRRVRGEPPTRLLGRVAPSLGCRAHERCAVAPASRSRRACGDVGALPVGVRPSDDDVAATLGPRRVGARECLPRRWRSPGT